MLATAAAVVVLVVVGYNRLVRLRNETDEAFASIDVQLQRRADLIPNLVSTVQAYAGHEAEVLQRVTEARAAVKDAHGVEQTAAADTMLSGALGRLFAVAEAYPELRASENFRHLQDELVDTEDKVALARRYYNTVVRRYNTSVQSLPVNLIAMLFDFGARPFYRVDSDSDRDVPPVALQGRA